MNVFPSAIKWTTGVLAAMLLVVACNENTTTPTDTPPEAPSGLMATSIDSETIGLKWTAPATGQTPTGYEIVYKAQGTSTEYTAEVGTSTEQAIAGLTEGTVYDIWVVAVNGTAKSSSSASVKWSPAKRLITNLRLYETASALGSGIDLPDLAGLTIEAGGLWDLCLDTRGGSFDIGSPTKSSYTTDELVPKFPNGDPARVTMVGKTYTNCTDLNLVYESADLATVGTLQEALINFNAAHTAGQPFAFVVKTADGHFAKVRVRANGGQLLQGTADNRYVDLEISYQSGANIPYAKIDQATGNPSKKVYGNTTVSSFKKND
jgi:hypothetical protein